LTPGPVSGGMRRAERGRLGHLAEAHARLSDLLIAIHYPASRKLKVDTSRFHRAAFVEMKDVIHGASVGPARPRATHKSMAPPGADSLRLYVSLPLRHDDLADLVHEIFGDPLLKHGLIPYEVIHTERARLLSNVDRKRPASCGLSCSHKDGPPGTIGFVAQAKGTDTRRFIVSNNHILANTNRGSVGNEVYQPSKHDQASAEDVIATLFRWAVITPSGPNIVDCASALLRDPSVVRANFVQHIEGKANYFKVGTRPDAPGPRVGKCGRSTEVKAGRVQSRNATITVDMGGWDAVFLNQIEIADEQFPFSDGGDSGALVWNFDEDRRPVGLLFARQGDSTYANPIKPVLDALQVKITH